MTSTRFVGLLVAAVLVTTGAVAVLILSNTSLFRSGTETPLSTGAMSAFEVHMPPKSVPDDLQFQQADGTPISLQAFRGRVVLINLWASWCAPCLTELPTLNALQRDLGSDEFEVLAVNLDRKSHVEKAKTIFADLDLDALSFYSDPTARINLKFGAMGLPTTILINREGREAGRLVGDADWSSEEAKAIIRHYVRGPADDADSGQ